MQKDWHECGTKKPKVPSAWSSLALIKESISRQHFFLSRSSYVTLAYFSIGKLLLEEHDLAFWRECPLCYYSRLGNTWHTIDLLFKSSSEGRFRHEEKSICTLKRTRDTHNGTSFTYYLFWFFKCKLRFKNDEISIPGIHMGSTKTSTRGVVTHSVCAHANTLSYKEGFPGSSISKLSFQLLSYLNFPPLKSLWTFLCQLQGNF